MRFLLVFLGAFVGGSVVAQSPVFVVENKVPPTFTVTNRMPVPVPPPDPTQPAPAGKQWQKVGNGPWQLVDVAPGVATSQRPFLLPGTTSPTTQAIGVTSPGVGFPSTSFPAAGQYRGATSTPTLRAIPGGTWTSNGCVSPFG